MAYAAGDVLVRVILESSTGLPIDRVVNDFAFKHTAGTPTSTDLGHLVDAVDGFYNDTMATSGFAAGKYLSSAITRSATHHIETYSLASGLPMGSPIRIDNWVGPPSAIDGTGCPTEVACVLTFHADLTGVPEESGATRPKARRRGRIYFGPLNRGTVSSSTPYRFTDSALPVTLREAANSMHDEAAGQGWDWCVWSRKDSTLRPVVGGWTDDAPDTQRRRGIGPSARTAYVV